MKNFLVWRNILRNPVFRIEGIVHIARFKNVLGWNSFREEREERLSIRRLEERFVVETTMLSSTDRRFVILCWGGYSEGISIDGWQLVAGLYISAINLALASPIEIRLLAIILSDLEVGARRWSFHNFLRRFSERPPFSSPPFSPPLCLKSVSLLDNWIKRGDPSMTRFDIFGGLVPIFLAL